MNRRGFLLAAARPRPVTELSCERLYMRYLDARGAGRTQEFLVALERDLTLAAEIRLTGREWLAHDDFRAAVEPLLRECRPGRRRHA